MVSPVTRSRTLPTHSVLPHPATWRMGRFGRWCVVTAVLLLVSLMPACARPGPDPGPGPGQNEPDQATFEPQMGPPGTTVAVRARSHQRHCLKSPWIYTVRWDDVEVTRVETPDRCMTFTTWFNVPAAAEAGPHPITVSDSIPGGVALELGVFTVVAST
jgi:hypothetical protein